MKTCSKCGGHEFTELKKIKDREGVVVHIRYTCDGCGAGYRENAGDDS